jgi:predicted nucleic acid-binding Zn ribbon protein
MPSDPLSGSTWVSSSAAEPQRLQSSLDRVARRFGARSAGGMAAVFDRWTEIVGEAAAAHATPVRLAGSTLHVQVDHAAWASQLAHLQTTVIGRLDDVAGPGVVTAVRYRVGRP